MTDNVTEIGVKFKKPIKGDERMLRLRGVPTGCFDHSYVIDAEADKVTCSKCEKSFNPMSVLVDLARKESRWMMNMQRYQKEMKRLSERQRTKCNKCGHMTRISRN